MPERVVCDICGAVLRAAESYVVRVEVYADPTLPPVSTEELEESDPAATMADLLKQMEHRPTTCRTRCTGGSSSGCARGAREA